MGLPWKSFRRLTERLIELLRLSSPHVHTQFCDAKSTAEEMVLSALSRGFVSLGFSGHAKQDFDTYYVMDKAKEVAYLREVRSLRERFNGRIRIWLGMERDYFSNASREPYDYVIGSVHYLPCPDGSRFPVDAPLEAVRYAIRQHFNGDTLKFVKGYYSILGNYARDYQPDIIGHFDLPAKNNRQGELYDREGLLFFKAAAEAMEEAVTGCRLMEVNTGGMARYGASIPYPKLKLLKYWKALGGEIILSSDCHRAEDINAGYEEAYQVIRAAGYKKAAILGRHKTLFEWVEFA
jgi:histidinol-phosphatase (PHP family)